MAAQNQYSPPKREVSSQAGGRSDDFSTAQIPDISLPKGGGAIQGIGEKFEVSAVSGTGSLSVPLAISPGRNGFGPSLALGYDSGSGNSPYGLGWNIGIASITRKTQKGLPRYDDVTGSDTFLLAGAEDLVPTLQQQNDGSWQREVIDDTNYSPGYKVYRYRPRIEGGFARIERWVRKRDQDTHWRTITGDNRTTIYGQSPEARIHHPDNPHKTFSWLAERSYDDKGNIIGYAYKSEDTTGVDSSLPQEKNRLQHGTGFTQKYLKQILYGNALPYLPHRNDFDETGWETENRWHFQVVLDYGEHPGKYPAPDEKQPWPVRSDPFSTFRSGFEIRTYRLCRRILMYHFFPDELGPDPYLVASTSLEFNENAVATQVESIHYWRYEKGKEPATVPPVSFAYTEAVIDDHTYPTSGDEVYNVPTGNPHRWFDLEGEGLTGILSRYRSAWYYRRNLGNGRFGPKEVVGSIPSIAEPGDPSQQLTDLTGDGKTDLVVTAPQLNGYFEMTDDNRWNPFTFFSLAPHVDLNAPDTKFIDLTGNGLADIMITENDCILWHASEARDGYGAAQRVSKVLDEEQGPTVIFADAQQSVFLADMSGDGLTDIARIRNGEVCYWPNTGYATFGTKVTMNEAPWFDHPEDFDPKNIRLGDIDGSGTMDILYVYHDKVRYWINRSGNDWSEPREITHLPYSSNVTSVELLDLLGNGTACLVWTSTLPEDDGSAPIRYIPLMSHLKPYLLTEIDNHRGGVKRMQYAPSTRFYLEDRQAGKPWITKLPFPVHVVERIESLDRITGTAFSSRYAYHHGYFDGEEREFRGFGMVEQWDTEDYESFGANRAFAVEAGNWQEDSHVPPVHTRTWFHTGIFMDLEHISRLYRQEFYRDDPEAWALPDTSLPDGLTAAEQREACRALKGRVLRSEVYGLDGSAEADHPYSVAETMYHIRLEQPKAGRQYAVFYVCNCESLSYNYERKPDDPRITHSHTLEIDRYGNPLKTASIVYPRRSEAVSPEQSEMVITCQEHALINLDDTLVTYRTGLPFENRSYEVRGLAFNGKWEKTDLNKALNNAVEVEYTAPPGATPEKRLLGRTRVRYYKNTLDAADPLPWGEADTLAIPCESYRLVFTGDMLSQPALGGRITPALLQEGHYRNDIDGDPTHWWIPSGISLFGSNAHDRFYLPDGIRDPFGQESQVTYDACHLFPAQTTDPLGNTTTARHDYRVLAPWLLTDPNGNRSRAVFDTRGAVVATAIMGKENENDPAQMGDNVDNYIPVPVSLNTNGIPEDSSGDIIADPHKYLQDAGSFFYYDLFAWEREQAPSVAIGVARETHVPLSDNTPSKIQISLTYSWGMGQEVLTKIQAEPGEAFIRDENGELVTDVNGVPVKDDVAVRWVGNGRAVLNNKGDPVRQYEPYFSSTYAYESETELREYGVSPTLHYDAAGRNTRTDLPDGTFTRVNFTPWMTETFDPNDTVLESDWFARAGSPDPDGAEPVNDPLARAAWLAARHADTPETTHLDSLGRSFLSLAHNRIQGQDTFIPARSVLDIEGNPLTLFDGRGSEGLNAAQALSHQGNTVMSYVYAMGGVQLYQNSMDGGERWAFPGIDGQPLYSWDGRGNRFRSEYDALRRPLRQWLMQENAEEILIGSTVYGESAGDPGAFNLRGQLWQVFDQSGKATSVRFDFKGNLLQSRRRLASDYKTVIDWSINDPGGLLETEAFIENLQYDALNRPIQVETADGSLRVPEYNEAGLLEKVTATVKGLTTEVVQNIDYNEKGQRVSIRYGNGSVTRYFYDPETFRLLRLLSTRNSGQEILQDIFYTYDPAGNITGIEDHAQDTVFNNNILIEPKQTYVYDALYRLTEATGREFATASGPGLQSHEDLPWVTAGMPHQANLRPYRQRYAYDAAGNILSMQHMAGNNGSWTRDYQYGPQNNRLTQTSVPGQANTWLSYTQDAHGNMQLPHLPAIQWDYADRMRQVDLGGGGTACYVYGADGGRIRKMIERQGGLIQERIYLGDVEIYREHQGNQLRLERETLHVSDDQTRVAMVETKTVDLNDGSALNQPQYRYQYGNHLGSVSLELDEQARIISYEEYHPYGTTAYRAKHQQIEVSEIRYRYTGKEKDEETGLYYHGARYYAPWLARWTAADPAGLVDGANLYQYTSNNPITHTDPTGTQAEDYYTIPATPDEAATLYDNDCILAVGGPGMLCHGNTPSGPSLLDVPPIPGSEGMEQKKPKPKPAPKPKPKPKPKEEEKGRELSYEELYALAMALQPRLIYPKPVRQVLGGIQFVGGSIEALGGFGFAIITAETVGGAVVGGLVGLHGLDVAGSGWTTMWTGEESKTYTFMAGAGWTSTVTDDPQWINVGGQATEMFANAGSAAFGLKMMYAPLKMSSLERNAGFFRLGDQLIDETHYLASGMKGGKGDAVLAGLVDTRTGEFYFSRNAPDWPDPMHPLIADEYLPYLEIMDEGISMKIGHLGPAGAHGEIQVLNQALWARQFKFGSVTQAEMSEFLLYTVSIRGIRAGQAVPRCMNCWFLTPNVNYIGPSFTYKY